MKKAISLFKVIALVTVILIITGCDNETNPETNNYTVIFNAYGGIPVPANQVIPNGGKINEPQNMSKDGSTFAGWYRDSSFITPWNFSSDIVTSNITLHAKWNSNNCCEGNCDPCDCGSECNNLCCKESNDCCAGNCDPCNCGFDCDGLCCKESNDCCEGDCDPCDCSSECGKLCCVTYTVIFNSDGGTPAPENQAVTGNGKVIEPPVMSRIGYTFGGWYKDEEYSNAWDLLLDTVIDNTTLYAKWSPITYTISYYGNFSFIQGTTVNSIHTYNVEQALNLNGFTTNAYGGYIFAGWATSQNGPVVYMDGESVINLSTTNGDWVSLFAKWIAPYTVNYSSNGGEGDMERSYHFIDIAENLNTNMFTKRFYTFMGWATESNGPVVYMDSESVINLSTELGWIELYAVWEFIIDNLPLAEKLAWVNERAQWYNEYIIEVNADESIDSFSLQSPVSLVLIGKDAERTIQLSSKGNMFTINGETTLTLGENITLSGLEENNASLVYVNEFGKFIMNTGSRIINNSTSSNGGGVFVFGEDAVFTMNGGEISGNSASNGGGVYVGASRWGAGTFTMNGGEILNNTASSHGGGVYMISNGILTVNDGKIANNSAGEYGGGVHSGIVFNMQNGEISGNSASYGGGIIYYSIGGGAFTMNGGKILNNSADNDGGGIHASGQQPTINIRNDVEISGNSASNGGGIYFSSTWGTINMFNGVISDNSAEYGGGVNAQGNFVMHNGKISDNSAVYGGGIYGSNITMHGGEISSNTAYNRGGGVYVGGTFFNFTMYNGTISGNSVKRDVSLGLSGGNGGGVYVGGNSNFTMHNGTISGNSVENIHGDGGGVCVDGAGTFRISNGIIYGSNEITSIRNTSTSSGAAFYITPYGGNAIAEHGTFSGSTWNSNGSLSTTDNTIRVNNGMLY